MQEDPVWKRVGEHLQRLRARAVDRIAAHLKAEMRKLEDDNQLLYALTLGQVSLSLARSRSLFVL